MPRRLALVVLLHLSVASCSGDDGEPPDREAIEGELARLFDRASPATPEAAECVAERLAAAYTPDELVEARLLTDEYRAPGDMPQALTHGDAVAWVDASIACVDYIDVAGRTYVDDNGTFDEAAFRLCVDGQVDEASVRTALIDTYSGMGTSDTVVRLSAVLLACAEKQK